VGLYNFLLIPCFIFRARSADSFHRIYPNVHLFDSSRICRTVFKPYDKSTADRTSGVPAVQFYTSPHTTTHRTPALSASAAARHLRLTERCRSMAGSYACGSGRVDGVASNYQSATATDAGGDRTAPARHRRTRPGSTVMYEVGLRGNENNSTEPSHT